MLTGFIRKKKQSKQYFSPFVSCNIMVLRIAIILFLFFPAVESHAQFWKNKKKKEQGEPTQQQPTSLNPSSFAEKDYAAKASRKSSKGPTYGLEQEYYERMEEVAKTRRKSEKIMEKPQYSDPLYFGHKRPPKKRKPSKMKFCKECGIRH